MERLAFTVMIFICCSLWEKGDCLRCGASYATVCNATETTSTSCMDNVCSCLFGYYPIPTGCGEKPGTPTLIIPPDRSNRSVIPYVEFDLSVTPVEGADEYILYRSFLRYGVSTTGQFTIQLEFSSEDIVLKTASVRHRSQSVLSEAVTVRTLSLFHGLPEAPDQPTLLGIPDEMDENGFFTVNCGNLPLGFSDALGDIKVWMNGEPHENGALFIVDESLLGADVFCNVSSDDVQFTTPNSEHVRLPEQFFTGFPQFLFDNIGTIAVNPNASEPTIRGSRDQAYAVNLRFFLLSLVVFEVDTMETTIIPNFNRLVFELPTDRLGTFTYGLLVEKGSATDEQPITGIRLIVEPNYIATPTPTVTLLHTSSEGYYVQVECVNEEVHDEYVYAWTLGGEVIQNQKARVIYFYQTIFQGMMNFSCEATKYQYTASSPVQAFPPLFEKLPAPTLTPATTGADLDDPRPTDTFTFTCFGLYKLQSENYTWFKDNLQVDESGSEYETIVGVTDSKIACSYVNDNMYPSFEAAYILRPNVLISVAVYIDNSSAPVIGYKGQSVEVKCHVELAQGANPILNYTWQINGTTVVQSSPFYHLVESDDMEFNCTVSINGVYTLAAQQTGILTVQGLPTPRVELVEGSLDALPPFTEHVISCNSGLAEDKVDSYRWYFDTIHNGTTTKTFTILSTFATTSCACDFQAFGFWSSESNQTDIRASVMSGLSALLDGESGSSFSRYEGGNLTVSCNYSLLPGVNAAINLAILFDGNEVSDTDSYTFSATSGASKVVTCKATYRTDEKVAQFTLTIQALPTPTLTVSNDPRPGVFESGNQYTLVCNSNIVLPEITYVWLIDGQESNQTQSNSFAVTATSTTQTITCRVTRYDAFSPVHIDIFGKSILRTEALTNGHTSSSSTFYAGRPVILTCRVSLYPLVTVTPDYQWVVDGVDEETTETKSFDVAGGNNKSYVCEATIGEDSVSSSSVNIVGLALPTPSLTLENDPQPEDFKFNKQYNFGCIRNIPIEITNYVWLSNDNPIADAISQRHTIVADTTFKSYSCQYRHYEALSNPSNSRDVKANGIKSVAILKDGLTLSTWTPVAENSITLTCQVTLLPEILSAPTYVWSLGSLPEQTTESATFIVPVGFNLDVVCFAHFFTQVVRASVRVIAQEVPVAPSVTPLDANQEKGVDVFLRGGMYTLECFSTSQSAESKYTWKVDGKDLPYVTGKSLVMKDVQSLTTNGVYACVISTNRGTATSSGYEINVKAGGRICQRDSTCSGFQYSGKCRQNRCVCSANYVKKGDSCQSFACRTLASVLLVFTAFAGSVCMMRF